MTPNSSSLQTVAIMRLKALDKIVVNGVEYRLHSETDAGLAFVEKTGALRGHVPHAPSRADDGKLQD